MKSRIPLPARDRREHLKPADGEAGIAVTIIAALILTALGLGCLFALMGATTPTT